MDESTVESEKLNDSRIKYYLRKREPEGRGNKFKMDHKNGPRMNVKQSGKKKPETKILRKSVKQLIELRQDLRKSGFKHVNQSVLPKKLSDKQMNHYLSFDNKFQIVNQKVVESEDQQKQMFSEKNLELGMYKEMNVLMEKMKEQKSKLQVQIEESKRKEEMDVLKNQKLIEDLKLDLQLFVGSFGKKLELYAEIGDVQGTDQQQQILSNRKNLVIRIRDEFNDLKEKYEFEIVKVNEHVFEIKRTENVLVVETKKLIDELGLDIQMIDGSANIYPNVQKGNADERIDVQQPIISTDTEPELHVFRDLLNIQKQITDELAKLRKEPQYIKKLILDVKNQELNDELKLELTKFKESFVNKLQVIRQSLSGSEARQKQIFSEKKYIELWMYNEKTDMKERLMEEKSKLQVQIDESKGTEIIDLENQKLILDLNRELQMFEESFDGDRKQQKRKNLDLLVCKERDYLKGKMKGEISKLQVRIEERKRTKEIAVLENQKLISKLNMDLRMFEERLKEAKRKFDENELKLQKEKVHMENQLLSWLLALVRHNDYETKALKKGFQKQLEKSESMTSFFRGKLNEELETQQRVILNDFETAGDLETDKYKAKIKQNENLRLQLCSEIKKLQEEKQEDQLEGESLRKEVPLSELLEMLQEELVRVRTNLYESKAKEKVLEQELTEGNKKQEESLQIRRDIIDNFGKIVETELQCNVCSELLVKAVTLNCMHSFCTYCIRRWKNTKKCCPMCRGPIKAENRSIVLDNVIEKLVENLSEDIKKRRIEVVEDRKAKELLFTDSDDSSSSSESDSDHFRGRYSSPDLSPDFDDWDEDDIHLLGFYLGDSSDDD